MSRVQNILIAPDCDIMLSYRGGKIVGTVVKEV